MHADEFFDEESEMRLHDMASILGHPNDTPKLPLYRQDKHPLKLADYEAEGKHRKENQHTEDSSISGIGDLLSKIPTRSYSVADIKEQLKGYSKNDK